MAALRHSTKLHEMLYVRYKQAQSADGHGVQKMELRVARVVVCSVRGSSRIREHSGTQALEVIGPFRMLGGECSRLAGYEKTEVVGEV